MNDKICTNGNRNEYSTIPCNLLTYCLDDVIVVIRHKSRQLNFTVHVKINHIEFEDKFLIQIHENVKYF